MRQNDDLGAGPQQQLTQIRQQIVPGRRTIGIAGQRERIQLTEQRVSLRSASRDPAATTGAACMLANCRQK